MANEVVAVYVDKDEAAPKTLILAKTGWSTITKLNKLRRDNYRMIQIVVRHQQSPPPAAPNSVRFNDREMFFVNLNDPDAGTMEIEVRDYNPLPERADKRTFDEDGSQSPVIDLSRLAAQTGGGMSVALEGYDTSEDDWSDLNDEANAPTNTDFDNAPSL